MPRAPVGRKREIAAREARERKALARAAKVATKVSRAPLDPAEREWRKNKMAELRAANNNNEKRARFLLSMLIRFRRGDYRYNEKDALKASVKVSI